MRRNDANLVYLFTNARDEKSLPEWVAHHLLLGFDHIVIFDHKSEIPITNVFSDKSHPHLTIIRVKGDGNIKIPLMKRAVNISKQKNVSWMLYLDADEFLVLNAFNNVKHMLNTYEFADSLAINWLMFGSSGHITQPSGLLMENFVNSDKLLNQHVKTFVRPNQVVIPASPHSYKIYNPNRMFAVTGNKTTVSPFNKVPIIFIRAPAYIAHFIVQSEQEFIRRKGRAMDDGTGTKTHLYTNILNVHNEVPNYQLHTKYINRVKEYLFKGNPQV